MIVTVPARLFSVPAAVVLKAMLAVSAPSAVPESSIEPFVNEKLVTVVPLIPLSAVWLITIRVSETSRVLVSDIPAPVLCWIVPPDPALPDPRTDRPPLEPVLLSTMPLAGPDAPVPAEMLLNFRPLAPMVVFATLSAVAVVVVRVLVVSVADHRAAARGGEGRVGARGRPSVRP